MLYHSQRGLEPAGEGSGRACVQLPGLWSGAQVGAGGAKPEVPEFGQHQPAAGAPPGRIAPA